MHKLEVRETEISELEKWNSCVRRLMVWALYFKLSASKSHEIGLVGKLSTRAFQRDHSHDICWQIAWVIALKPSTVWQLFHFSGSLSSDYVTSSLWFVQTQISWSIVCRVGFWAKPISNGWIVLGCLHNYAYFESASEASCKRLSKRLCSGASHNAF